MKLTQSIPCLTFLSVLTVFPFALSAQQYPPVGGRQFPLNQMTPPGTVAQWAMNAGRVSPNTFQPVRVELPAPGTVTIYESIERPVEIPSPAQAGLFVGHLYRLKISGLEEFPGVDFFPSIELVDRLHPPAGREEDFPITFEFTTEEFEWAASGRLVTKVIYLEQPQRVPLSLLESSPRIMTIEPSRNALAEADVLGRPVAIVRFGGRMPDPHQPDPQFFGPGGPVRVVVKSAPAPGAQVDNHRGKNDVGSTRVSRKSLSGGTREGGIRQVHYIEEPIPACPREDIPACPPISGRVPTSVCPPSKSTSCRCEVTYLAEKFPDEYLCDGGDRDFPVHYDRLNRNGLDTEDTVAEFTDHTGKNHVRASNRICLYAPRCSTIRTISRPHEGMNLNEAAGVKHSAGTDSMRTRLKPTYHVKNEMSGRVLVRSRASGLESEQLQGNVSSLKRLVIHEKLLNVYQDLTFVQSGKLETAELARLNFGLQAALLWTREQNPVISVKTETAMTGNYDAHTATITGIDDKKSDEPGDLRIVKLADKQTAQTGDIVEFTIRYDNLGPNTVEHVRIVDNLTPRLLYIDDSATSDRAGRLVVHDNGEGSLVLVWELTDPLPTKTGGVVSFKAKIR